MIRAKCTRMLKDAAEAADVAQETFIRLWQSGSIEREPAQIGAWIYRTSTRIAIDRLRQRSRLRALQLRAASAAELPGSTRQSGAMSEDEAALLARRLVAHLCSEVPKEELEIVILSRIDLLTHLEIAEVVDCSERTVRRMLQRFDERVQQIPEEMRP